MFFVEHASQILALVNAIIDSVSAIVKGNITAAAARVENALAKAIPVAIGFLASLLGLGDPSKPVKETIEKAQSPVNKAIDWVIQGRGPGQSRRQFRERIVREEGQDKISKREDDPEKAAKIEAGLVALNRKHSCSPRGRKTNRGGSA